MLKIDRNNREGKKSQQPRMCEIVYLQCLEWQCNSLNGEDPQVGHQADMTGRYCAATRQTTISNKNLA